MSRTTLFATNTFAGTSTAADSLPKTVKVVCVGNKGVEHDTAQPG